MVGFPFLFIFTAAWPASPYQPRFYIRRSRVSRYGAETRGKAGILLETGRGERGEERRESLAEASHPIFYDILFPIRGRRCRGITGVGPYATFMALNRDEVSPEWPLLPTFFFFPLFLPSADLHAILSRSLKHGTLRRK